MRNEGKTRIKLIKKKFVYIFTETSLFSRLDAFLRLGISSAQKIIFETIYGKFREIIFNSLTILISPNNQYQVPKNDTVNPSL